MKFLKTFDSFLNRIEGAVLVFFLAVMVVMAFLQVILRNGFNSTILWVDILLRHLVLWSGFLGAALATSSERHINIDAVTRFLPHRIRLAVNALASLFSVVVCYYLLRASLTYLENEIAGSSTIYADIPSWYSEIIIPAGFGMLMVHFFVRFVLSAREAYRNEGVA